MEKTFQLEANSAAVANFRADLRELCQKAQLDDKPLNEVLLAVQEALTNVVRHAYEGKGGQVEVRFKDLGDTIEVSIRDHGKKFDLHSIPKPVLPPKKPGGLGVYLIKTLMDEVICDKTCEGNLLTLRKSKRTK